MNNDHAKGIIKRNGTLPSRVTSSPPATARYEQVFALTAEIVNIERQMNEKMSELSRLVRTIDDGNLPALLVDLLKRPSREAPQYDISTLPADAPLPSIEGFGIIELPTTITERMTGPVWAPGGFEARIIDLMKDGRERKAGTIIKALKAKSQKTSVYHALTALVKADELLKPAFGHYRMP